MTTAEFSGEPTPELPARLEEARLRFEGWRTTRPTKFCPIPPELWAAAVRCADEYGLYRTARILGLDSGKLKLQMHPGAKRPESGPATFVELVPGARAPLGECIVEIESRAGSRLRIQVKGTALADLVDLARSFVREAT